MIVKYHTLAFKSMASPEVWEEVSGGDTGMTGEGSIVTGVGVDVDITPPNTVRVGKAQGFPVWCSSILHTIWTH